jgi:hypothetical protein
VLVVVSIAVPVALVVLVLVLVGELFGAADSVAHLPGSPSLDSLLSASHMGMYGHVAMCLSPSLPPLNLLPLPSPISLPRFIFRSHGRM